MRSQNNADIKVISSKEIYPHLSKGIPLLVVENPFCKFIMSIYGGHVISYVPTGKQDLLWLSPKTQMTTGEPIRGGIPLCTPWFGPREGMPLHGFARISNWAISYINTTAEGETKIVLRLLITPETVKSWPYQMVYTYTIIAGTVLQLSMNVTNASQENIPFAFAYHTYFNVGNIRQVTINGFENCTYLDRLDAGKPKIQKNATATTGPIERMYLDVPQTQTIDSPLGRYQIDSATTNSLVWNAWENDRNIPDMGEGNHVGYVCVERGDMAKDGILLAAGKNYCADMTLWVL